MIANKISFALLISQSGATADDRSKHKESKNEGPPESIPYGYHNSKSHGGVITGNGQRLKIGYVYYNEQYGNIIVYIEEIREA